MYVNVCMYVRMYVCMYVCVYECICVYMYVCVCLSHVPDTFRVYLTTVLYLQY